MSKLQGNLLAMRLSLNCFTNYLIMNVKIIFLLLALTFLGMTQPEILFHHKLEEVEIKGIKASYNIRTEQDSVKAIAMLLNRECPTCSEEEKYYVASCIVTGTKKYKTDWKTYLFDMGQFWGFSDKRIQFNPKNKIHRSNLEASKRAWEHPKNVLFYASEIDSSQHFNQVSKNGTRPKGFYHFFSNKL